MSIKIDVSAASLASFEAALRMKEAEVTSLANSAMDQAAQKLFENAQSLVPVQTGALRDSGKVTNTDSGKHLERTISYGSANSNPRTGRTTATYAVRVHEVVNKQHPESFKWLERSLNQYSEEYSQVLAAALRAAFV